MPKVDEVFNTSPQRKIDNANKVKRRNTQRNSKKAAEKLAKVRSQQNLSGIESLVRQSQQGSKVDIGQVRSNVPTTPEQDVQSGTFNAKGVLGGNRPVEKGIMERVRQLMKEDPSLTLKQARDEVNTYQMKDILAGRGERNSQLPTKAIRFRNSDGSLKSPERQLSQQSQSRSSGGLLEDVNLAKFAKDHYNILDWPDTPAEVKQSIMAAYNKVSSGGEQGVGTVENSTPFQRDVVRPEDQAAIAAADQNARTLNAQRGNISGPLNEQIQRNLGNLSKQQAQDAIYLANRNKKKEIVAQTSKAVESGNVKAKDVGQAKAQLVTQQGGTPEEATTAANKAEKDFKLFGLSGKQALLASVGIGLAGLAVAQDPRGAAAGLPNAIDRFNQVGVDRRANAIEDAGIQQKQENVDRKFGQGDRELDLMEQRNEALKVAAIAKAKKGIDDKGNPLKLSSNDATKLAGSYFADFIDMDDAGSSSLVTKAGAWLRKTREDSKSERFTDAQLLQIYKDKVLKLPLPTEGSIYGTNYPKIGVRVEN